MKPSPSVHVRIPRSLYERIHVDLKRPHHHAAERVGFLITSFKQYADGSFLLLMNDYHPLSDDEYVPDSSCGARIGSDAIRAAMQRVMNTGLGSFHVHIHYGSGIPCLSNTDRRELPRLVQSLCVVGPDCVHGIFLLSENACTCWVWLPGFDEPVVPEQISVVSYPMTFIHPHSLKVISHQERYSRQSFLGLRSQQLFEQVRVGIVGLGGGGSHIVQQLAHIGVRHFHLFDGDVVDESNLNRLVGGIALDAEGCTPKLVVAKRVITSLNPEAKIISHRGSWQEKAELLEQCDLIFGCVDTFSGRRDLEATCRRYLIPYIDIGMDVHCIEDEPPRMAGQIILSMPGFACMHCLGFLTDKKLSQEAALYGDAGGRPQVVWSNGVLASTAVGVGIDLLTGWTQRQNVMVFLSYDGNLGTLSPDRRLSYINTNDCPHYQLAEIGPPRWQQSSKCR